MTKSELPERVLLVFVDGLGWPPVPLDESMYAGMPALRELLQEHAVSIDATLGMPGLPQSATGQTAIFTGINAARQLGRHVEGFPNQALREIVAEHSVFRRLTEAGRTCTFANAYLRGPARTLPKGLRSVTTVMTYEALGTTRERAELDAGRAVFHDVIRASAVKIGIGDVPLISEETGADHLLAVLREVDFCLFEYFLTDHAGHRGDFAWQQAVLHSVDRLVAGIVAGLDQERELFLLVSDHGNIESRADHHHTANPVPWIALGRGAELARAGCRSLLDVTPKILALLQASGSA
ncbi:MAG: peptidase [Victivallales bacterium]|nr:peptidase [Victivallales bacterium]